MIRSLQYFIAFLILVTTSVPAQNKSIHTGETIFKMEKIDQTDYKKSVRSEILYKKNLRINQPLEINAGPYLDLESFEDFDFPPIDWESYTEGIDPWEQTDNDAIDGDYSAVSYGEYTTAENWLITPQIDLSSASIASLTYYDLFDDSYAETDQDQFIVLISTDYSGSGDPGLATWNEIHSGSTEPFNWNLQSIDLSPYIGQTVHIAFRYIPYFDGVDYIPGTDWYIDAVRVSDDGCTGIELIPDSATIDSPPDGATLMQVDVPLLWFPPYYEDITKQFLYVGTDGGGTSTPTNIYNGLELSNFTQGITLPNLDPNTTYYWQVVPANCAYEAQNCPIWSFTTGDGNLNYGGGGPTQGNYYFANSTSGASGSPSQPVFNWIDISATGTDLISSIIDEQTKGPYNLGFSFDFFGNTYTQFYINANGFVAFQYPSGQVAFGFPMPSISGPENLIAGFWMNLNPTNTNVTDKHLYYGMDNGDMVITFEKYPQYISFNVPGDENSWMTFQIIIKQNGNIKIQYKEKGSSFIVSGLNAGKVGIENNDGTKGILYKYSDTGGPVFDGSSPLALEFGQDAFVLPVELNSFTASVIDGNVKLDWETKTEIKNYGFDVERKIVSLNNSIWEKIGFIKGSGNSNSPKQYSFVDNKTTSGKYLYRLKQIDTDGQFEYSNQIEIDLEHPDKFSLNQNYPNPFNPSTVISFSVPVKSFTSLKIYDVLGNQIATLVSEEKQAGTYEINFDGADLTSGIYFYKLQTENFIDTKKMILLR